MSELFFKHFETARTYLLKNIAALDESIVDVQPEGFNNTLHWHVGHVLTVTEQFLFGYPKKSTHLPANYLELFGKGTKPADWQGEVPSVQELSVQLTQQIERVKGIHPESFNEKLKTPFLGQETYGELANFAIFHESMHLGQIQAMNRVLQTVVSK